MAKVSKSIILAYNKCASLTPKFANILDSFWHKDEKIPASALADDVTVEVVNNLTSTDTDKALAANQGRILDEKITAITNYGDGLDPNNEFITGLN